MTREWEIYDEAAPFAGARYGPQRARMVVLGLEGGGLLAISPASSLSDEQWEQLESWGEPRFLLAPNHFHNMGIPKWKRRYPEARVVAHPAAHPRLKRKLGLDEIEDLEPVRAALPEGAELLTPPGAQQGETWLSISRPEGAAWYIVDAVINEEKLVGGMGLALRALGFRARLMNNPLFRRFYLREKPRYRSWAKEQLERHRPTLLVPAHGGLVKGEEVAERLGGLFEQV